MAHKQQRKFCRLVKRRHPDFFYYSNVIDVGSLDINGNNRRFFSVTCNYVGIDIVPGRNVDIVGPAHLKLPEVIDRWEYRFGEGSFHVDVVISTEMLEHDRHWSSSLCAMYDALKPGGLMLITAAGEGRQEHGTHHHSPSDSPGTNDYYQNVTNDMFSSALPAHFFKVYHLAQHNKDFQFYGIKA